MDFDLETVLVSSDDGITTVMLNRPDKRNAMSPQLHRDMHEALTKLRNDPETKVVVITGTGKSFCAGQDLKEYFADARDDQAAQEYNSWLSHEWRHRVLNHYPKPTIAAINGFCFGGAFTIVASCDVAIAADEAIFGLSEINWGVFPGGLVSKVVVDLMPPRQALYYALTGEQFGGQRSVEIGFTTMSVPLDQLAATTLRVANVLKEKNPNTIRAIKAAMKAVDLRDLSNEDAHRWLTTIGGQLQTWNSETGHAGGDEGLDRFLNKEYRPGVEVMPSN